MGSLGSVGFRSVLIILLARACCGDEPSVLERLRSEYPAANRYWNEQFRFVCFSVSSHESVNDRTLNLRYIKRESSFLELKSETTNDGVSTSVACWTPEHHFRLRKKDAVQTYRVQRYGLAKDIPDHFGDFRARMGIMFDALVGCPNRIYDVSIESMLSKTLDHMGSAPTRYGTGHRFHCDLRGEESNFASVEFVLIPEHHWAVHEFRVRYKDEGTIKDAVTSVAIDYDASQDGRFVPARIKEESSYTDTIEGRSHAAGKEVDFLEFVFRDAGDEPFDLSHYGVPDLFAAKKIAVAIPAGISAGKVSAADLNIGEVHSDEATLVKIVLHNSGVTPVRVIGFQEYCSPQGCVTAAEDDVTLPPMQSRSISIELTPKQRGEFAFEVICFTDCPEQPSVTCRITGHTGL